MISALRPKNPAVKTTVLNMGVGSPRFASEQDPLYGVVTGYLREAAKLGHSYPDLAERAYEQAQRHLFNAKAGPQALGVMANRVSFLLKNGDDQNFSDMYNFTRDEWTNPDEVRANPFNRMQALPLVRPLIGLVNYVNRMPSNQNRAVYSLFYNTSQRASQNISTLKEEFQQAFSDYHNFLETELRSTKAALEDKVIN